MLEELGHVTVHAATSGEAALAVLRRDGNFDLLLTDHLMPGMTGLQLATAARALHPSLPILLASGFAELDGLAGAEWPRLRKPYSLSDLSAALAISREKLRCRRDGPAAVDSLRTAARRPAPTPRRIPPRCPCSCSPSASPSRRCR